MKTRLFPSAFCLFALLFLPPIYGDIATADDVISRDGWSFDRHDLEGRPEEISTLLAEKGKRFKAAGWVEYDIEVPSSGWYELWLTGSPPEWARDIFVDGETITRLGISYGADLDETPPGQSNWFKEANIFLKAGEHTLRIRRLGFPGMLPTGWELRASTDATGSIRTALGAKRLIHVGGETELSVIGGAPEQTKYTFYLRNEVTGKESSIGDLEFAGVTEPITKTIGFQLNEPGLYSVFATSKGKELRPSDLKAGYFMAAEESDRQLVEDELRLAGMFRDGLILQQEMPLPIWGIAPAGEKVSIELGGQRSETVAGDDRRWKVVLEPMLAGGPAMELKVASAGKTITCRDVLMGEVWMASGQSNMGGRMDIDPDLEEWISKGDYPDVRMTDLKIRVLPDGDRLVEGFRWTNADFGGDMKKVKRWKPIQYAFATDLRRQLGVPVGIVMAGRGGTMITTWTSMHAHETNPAFQPILEGEQLLKSERVPELLHVLDYVNALRKWKQKAEQSTEAGKEQPRMPKPEFEISQKNQPAHLYESLIEPIAPFPMRGILWYQGESDGNMAAAYRERFPVMISEWRELWNTPDLPFYFVQIAYGHGEAFEGTPGDYKNGEIKEAQLMSLSVPHTKMAVTDDLMKPGDDVHYPNKLPLGHRLALIALADTYGRDLAFSGPEFKRQEIEGSQVRLYFDHADGLAVKGGEQLRNFWIAGEDRQWCWASARIDGETVVVSSPEVPEPVAVRYSWADAPMGTNLVNNAGLPAPVFRTDDWPMVTEGNFWIQKD
ncbi:MAG: sialate O-acetylesterase [Puniceicoccales bacterium]